MKVGSMLVVLFVVAGGAARAQAQQSATQNESLTTGPIAATWQLNIEASEFPGPKPRFGLPWRPLADGEFLIGLPFGQNVDGDSGYIFVPSGAPRERPKAGWPRVRRPPAGTRADAYTAKFDSNDGKFDVAVTRTESADGSAMTLSADLTNPQGRVMSYVLVFDRQ